MKSQQLSGKRLCNTSASLSVLAVLSLHGTPVLADQAAALEEVFVTAQRRQESLQDAPIAVTALSEEQLRVRGISGLSDLVAGAIPSLKVMPFPQSSATMIVTMRGVGPSDAGQITRDPGVGIYLDNVYLGRSQGLGMDLANLERIEVLRGPQGTLYGRNVMGGAVNMISKKPQGELAFRQTLSYSDDYDQLRAVTHLDLPQWAGISSQVSFVTSEHDGWVENTASSQENFSSFDKQGGRVALRWEPLDTLTVDYAYDRSDIDVAQSYYQIHDNANLTAFDSDLAPVPDLAVLLNGFDTPEAQELLANIESGVYLPGLVPYPDAPVGFESRTRADAYLPFTEVEASGHSLTAQWDLGNDWTVTSISAYRDMSQETHVNYLGAFGIGVATGAMGDDIDQDQFSQEFQFVGTGFDGRLDYVGGLYYYSEDASDKTPVTHNGLAVAFVPTSTDIAELASSVDVFPILSGGEFIMLDPPAPLGPPPYPPLGRSATSDVESWAVYGQGRYQVTDRLGLTLGARYTADEKDAHRLVFDGEEVDTTVHIDDSNIDPMVTLDYDLWDSGNVYLRWATAYKAGGVSLRSASFAEYDKEELESWEVGLKSDWLDHRVRLNMALYASTYDDMQIDFPDPFDITVVETFNAVNGDVDINGIEVELTVIPLPGLMISANYDYMDWDLREQPNPLKEGNPMEEFNLAQAPAHSGTLAVDYTFDAFSWGVLSLHGDYIGSSDMNYLPKDNMRYDARDIFNARATLSEINLGQNWGALQVALWAKNLTDEEYVIHSITDGRTGSVSTVYGEPKSIGVELIYDY